MSKAYDYSAEIDRHHTRASKYPEDMSADVVQMGTADMDIPCAPEIVRAMIARAEHPFYGYHTGVASASDACLAWQRRRKGYAIHPEWMRLVPSVISGINVAMDALALPGEKVLTLTPAYPPFFSAAGRGFILCQSALFKDEDGRYRIDFDDVEAQFQQGVRVLLLCSPHNPVGRVWTGSELERLAELCARYDVRVICDEIHSDLILPGNRHIPIATVPGMEARTVTLYSASKTFSLAGLNTAFMVVPDPDTRRRVGHILNRAAFGEGNLFGLLAAETGYSQCEGWLDGLCRYLAENVRIAREALDSLRIPSSPVEGTYLLWMDCRNIIEKDAERFFLEGNVRLVDGAHFGREFSGFARMNLACPRAQLERALALIGLKAAPSQTPAARPD